MNAYEKYLEERLKLKDEEIRIYKNFIEERLNCKIRDEVVPRVVENNGFVREPLYRVITIPESQYVMEGNW